MASMEYSSLFLILLFFISLGTIVWRSRKRRNSIPTNWPVVGMVPGVLVNIHRLHGYITDVMKESGGTIMGRGPWFADMDMLITTDPSNVNYVLSKNFRNYPKGPKFYKIFDFYGDGMFGTDGKVWETHRRINMSVFKNTNFKTVSESNLWSKVENGLLSVLEFVSRQDLETDLQDIFQRFAFDSICKLVLDYDPESLSIDFPHVPAEKAFGDAEEALFLRHILPEMFWELQERLRVGKEKKLSDAKKTIHQLISECISRKREASSKEEDVEVEFDLLKIFLREYEGQSGKSGDSDKFLRDTLLNLMAAGSDTTAIGLTWLFYLLAKNTTIQEKIREEIHTVLLKGETGVKWKRFSEKELDKLVYLHGAVCEGLRLYPPVPFQHKSPFEQDVLPSGHRVDQHTQLILSFYSMGRMESIWGEDCLEFKPERWFTEKGEIKREPSYKFTAFNAGPRTCLGKDMTLFQTKIVATTIINRYHSELVENHPVVPSDSMLLHMKHGLKVRLIDLKK